MIVVSLCLNTYVRCLATVAYRRFGAVKKFMGLSLRIVDYRATRRTSRGGSNAHGVVDSAKRPPIDVPETDRFQIGIAVNRVSNRSQQKKRDLQTATFLCLKIFG